MRKDMFEELLASVREGGEILQGDRRPSRVFNIETPDVKEIRRRFELSQREFARLLGISVGTLRNWEQGRRAPRGSARVLLRVAEKHPAEVWNVVEEELDQRASTGG